MVQMTVHIYIHNSFSLLSLFSSFPPHYPPLPLSSFPPLVPLSLFHGVATSPGSAPLPLMPPASAISSILLFSGGLSALVEPSSSSSPASVPTVATASLIATPPVCSAGLPLNQKPLPLILHLRSRLSQASS